MNYFYNNVKRVFCDKIIENSFIVLWVIATGYRQGNGYCFHIEIIQGYFCTVYDVYTKIYSINSAR